MRRGHSFPRKLTSHLFQKWRLTCSGARHEQRPGWGAGRAHPDLQERAPEGEADPDNRSPLRWHAWVTPRWDAEGTGPSRDGGVREGLAGSRPHLKLDQAKFSASWKLGSASSWRRVTRRTSARTSRSCCWSRQLQDGPGRAIPTQRSPRRWVPTESSLARTCIRGSAPARVRVPTAFEPRTGQAFSRELTFPWSGVSGAATLNPLCVFSVSLG